MEDQEPSVDDEESIDPHYTISELHTSMEKLELSEMTAEETSKMDSWLINTIIEWREPEDLDCKSLKDSVISHGICMLHRDPTIFMRLLDRAPTMHQSTHYIEVIQKMAEVYKTLTTNLSVGPLEHLMRRNFSQITRFVGYWGELLPLIEILMTIDVSQDARTMCLWMHIMQARYISPATIDSIQWTKQYVDIMKFLLQEGGDPTFIPKDSRESPVYAFFRSIPNILDHDDHVSVVKDLLPYFLTEKTLKHKEIQGTILHALINRELHCKRPDVFKEIVGKVIEASPSLLDMTDCNGRNPLQCSVSGPWEYEIDLELVASIVQMLKSDTSINAQDNNGNTALHLFISSLQVMYGHPWYSELVKCLVSPSNIDVQNEFGKTALHILLQISFYSPNLGRSFLPTLCSLTSSNNVNAPDINSVTPYSWVLQGKLTYEQGADGIFLKMEQVLLQYGADAVLAKQGTPTVECFELDMMFSCLSSPTQLDQWAHRIFYLLGDWGPMIFKENLCIQVYYFLIHNAFCFKESKKYFEIIQEMTDIYRKIQQKPPDKPMNHLVQLLNEPGQMSQHEDPESQKHILALIEILVYADEEQHLRTECLIALMNGRYPLYGRCGWIQWTEEFINILKLLLSNGADPTWIPDGWSEAASHIFFQCIIHIIANENNLYSALMDILPFFLSEKCLTQTDCQYTVLHALVGSTWEWLPNYLPEKFFDQYRNIVSEVVKAYPALIDKIDGNGRSPLQCFLNGIKACKYILSDIADIVQILISEKNVDIQDGSGRTALHYLAEILPLPHCCKDLDNHHRTFFDLFERISSAQNIHTQDENGRTVLHLLVRTAALCPNSGCHLLMIFPMVTTFKNVNAKDLNSVTPYSWILNGKMSRWKSEMGKIFSEIEKIFVNHEANAELASTGLAYIHCSTSLMEKVEMPESPTTKVQEVMRLSDFRKTISELRTLKDLDEMGHQIAYSLLCDGHRNIREDPNLLLRMVQKAKDLIASPCYVKIIEIMAEIYQTVERKPLNIVKIWRPGERKPVLDLLGPLDCLVDNVIMTNEELEKFCLFQHQDSFLSLVKILACADHNLHSRTKCLRTLVINSEYVSFKPYFSLQCTENFLKTLEFLLLKGADPACTIPLENDLPMEKLRAVFNGGILPNVTPWSQRLDSYTGHIFFQSITHILANKSHLVDTLLEILPLFLSERSLTYEDHQSTLLHALVSFNWRELSPHLPYNFLEQFKRIITMVIAAKPSLVDAIDRYGRIPLHYLLLGIRGRKDISKNISDIVKVLMTETNINTQDINGRTVLHYLCEIFPMDDSLPFSKNQNEPFLDLVKQSKSKSNTDAQDENGQTSLHILARAVFLHPNLAKDSSAVFDDLTTSKAVNTRDYDFVTPYSWILRGKLVHESSTSGAEGLFTKIEKIFLKNGADTAIAEGGLVSTMLLWIKAELSDSTCTLGRLRVLLNHMITVANWNSLFYSKMMTNDITENLIRIRNPDFVQIIMAILQNILLKKSAASYMFDAVLKLDFATTIGMETAYICTQGDVQLTQKHLSSLLQKTAVITVHGEHDLVFLKILLSLQKCNDFKNLLGKSSVPDFLGHRYIIGHDERHVAAQLVLGVYGSLELCVESKQWLNCFLIMSHGETRSVHLDDSLFNCNISCNGFHRSPVHLAVMLLRNEQSLKCLPQGIIQQHINEGDLHGCTPLHLAYLHHNESAVQFLIKNGAKTDITDKYGMTPQSMQSLVGNNAFETCESLPEVEQADVKHYQLCSKIITADSGVLEIMRSMLILDKKETGNLTQELQLLFQRLIEETEFSEAKIVLTGSLREKLKVGRLDEADIQIRFTGAMWPVLSEKKYKVGDMPVTEFQKKLRLCLIQNLAKIKWDGIYLRPVSFTMMGPWKFIREGTSAYHGITISVDIVAVLLHDEEQDKEAEHLVGDIVEGAPVHQRRSFANWKYLGTMNRFSETPFALEWHIIDSLPPNCRLAIGITKALVQAYEWNKGDRPKMKMPITSYTLKTALFFILAGKSEVPTIVEALRYACGPSEENKEQGEMKTGKLKFKPNPTWITEEDVNQHAEDARLLACKMFRFIKYLAMKGFRLNTYWTKLKISNVTLVMGEMEYVLKICDYLLKRLDRDVFY